jgi:hypothetical protein
VGTLPGIQDTQRSGEFEAAMDESLGENESLAAPFPARFHLWLPTKKWVSCFPDATSQDSQL